MEIVTLILKLLAVILPVLVTLFYAGQKLKEEKAKAKKETEDNAAKEPISAIGNGTSLEDNGSSLEDAANKW